MTTPPAPKPGPLPKGPRRLAIVALVLTGLVGAAAASEAMNLARLERSRATLDERADTLPTFGDPELTRKIWDTQLAVLQGMRRSRAVFLTGLALCCAVAFVSAARLLRPDGLPREGMRRLLVGATLGAAIFRTIDGAQMAVVLSRVRRVLSGWTPPGGLPPDVDRESFDRLLQIMPVASAVAFTALVAGSLLALSQYFRSKRVRDAVSG